MKITGNFLLRACCLVSAFISCFLWLVFYIRFFRNDEGLQKLDFLIHNFNIATYPFFCAFSVIILLRASSNTGVLFFSLFLSQISINIALNYVFFHQLNTEFEIYSAITFILTSFAYIKSFQNFPQQISPEDIHREFSGSKILRVYLVFFLNRKVWLVFPMTICVLALLFPANPAMKISVFLVVLLTAFLFLYVNFKISSPSSRNKIMWLIWGILCYTFISILSAIMIYSDSAGQQNIDTILKILRALSLFVSVTMCLFFFDTFDTGVLIKRTIVDGMIFILIVLLYNSIEHYFLHWMTHTLHISNTVVSSILSGLFVLIFSPVHHKFMHILDGRLNKKTAHAVNH